MITLEIENLTDFLHPALATALNTLDKVGSDFRLSDVELIRSVLHNIDRYKTVKDRFNTDPRAWGAIVLYCSNDRKFEDYLTDANSIDDFVCNIENRLNQELNALEEQIEDMEMINVMAKLMDKPIPYPDQDCPVDHYKDQIDAITAVE